MSDNSVVLNQKYQHYSILNDNNHKNDINCDSYANIYLFKNKKSVEIFIKFTFHQKRRFVFLVFW